MMRIKTQRNSSARGMSGFTLIELVIVLTIIGILAAIALPRYVDLQRDARIAKLNAARGAVGASSALVHAVALARNGVIDPAVCPGTAIQADNVNTVCTEHGVANIVNRYPAVTATANLGAGNPGIIGTAGLTAVFNPTVAQLQAEGYTVTGVGTVQTVQIQGAATPAQCQFTYTEAVAGAAPVISAVTTTGC